MPDLEGLLQAARDNATLRNPARNLTLGEIARLGRMLRGGTAMHNPDVPRKAPVIHLRRDTKSENPYYAVCGQINPITFADWTEYIADVTCERCLKITHAVDQQPRENV